MGNEKWESKIGENGWEIFKGGERIEITWPALCGWLSSMQEVRRYENGHLGMWNKGSEGI